MLNYLILVTQNTAVMAILLGLLYAHTNALFGKRGRNIFTVGALVGLLFAIIYAVLKNTTKYIDQSGGTGMWNVRIFAVSTVALLLYYIFSIVPLRRKTGKAGEIIISVLAAVLACTFVFYAMPEVLAYPFNFSLNGDSVFSEAFLFRFI